MNYTSFFTNMTTLQGFTTAANNATGGLLLWSFIGVMGMSLFFAAMPFGRSKAAAFSSFITGIVLLLLNNMGLTNWWLIAIDAMVFGASVILIMMNKKR